MTELKERRHETDIARGSFWILFPTAKPKMVLTSNTFTTGEKGYFFQR
jgi:hypothetical protein